MSLITVDQNRGKTHTFQIKNADGDVITPGTNDKVRVIIGREAELGGTPGSPTGYKLLVSTDGATANGSSLTKGTTNTLRLDDADVGALAPGAYSLLIDYFDNADAQEWQAVDRRVLFVGET